MSELRSKHLDDLVSGRRCSLSDGRAQRRITRRYLGSQQLPLQPDGTQNLQCCTARKFEPTSSASLVAEDDSLMLGQSNAPRVPGEIIPSPTWGALGIPGAGVLVVASMAPSLSTKSCGAGMGDIWNFAEGWALGGDRD
ncbi:hypothetical protein DHEL01_v209037 [Diaporthe helianthi]|uniref:Uncharacterized protein n=1 Tax=Diaporthe helianthi TaxID=158607 RepID=A0A2P5HQM8_DIAHE|nr:hypothetical protein DHEL01_v209037 [Diaporthe helianthi]